MGLFCFVLFSAVSQEVIIFACTHKYIPTCVHIHTLGR